MRWFISFILLLALACIGGLSASPARAEAALAVPGPCTAGVLPGRSNSLICVPSSGWNGDLIIYAHGYVPPMVTELTAQDLLLNGMPASTITQQNGYAFATTSYRTNGLAILEGQLDILELLDAFEQAYGAPAHTYLIGVSEGALVSTLLVEQHPERFSGALAACGPISGIRRQINYIARFRVLFDYFFPDVFDPHWTMQESAIPGDVVAGWLAGSYQQRIAAALAADPEHALQLIGTSRSYIDPADPTTTLSTTLDVLSYQILGTNDAFAKLGGNPFDNQKRTYHGSDDDQRLNQTVARFKADRAALLASRAYQPSGALARPLVALHTTGDDVVPFMHELDYQARVATSGAGTFTLIPITRYGHCNFQPDEVLGAFSLLVKQVTGAAPAGLSQMIALDSTRHGFKQARRAFGPATISAR